MGAYESEPTRRQPADRTRTAPARVAAGQVGEHRVVGLQRTAGNRAVTLLLQRDDTPTATTAVLRHER